MARSSKLMDMVATPDALDALLAGYVAGALPRPVEALVAAHLEMTDKNRRWARDLEALAAVVLEGAEPVAVADRDRRLGEIFALDDDPSPGAEAAPLVPPVNRACRDGAYPRALLAYLGRDIDDVPWKMVIPGIREYRMGEEDGCAASLLRIRAGQAIPDHTHHGGEVTLVLKGSFRDGTGLYEAGDVAFADDSVDHKPIAGSECECVCFAVTDAPLRLTGVLGRLLSPFTRH